jgi:ornithine carbamoyltransferase
MRHLHKTSDLSAADLAYLLKRSAKFKAKPRAHGELLSGDTVCLYFNKPSTRTRISFETAIGRLGGTPVFLGANDLQLGRGETIEDTSQVIGRYAKAFVIRTYKDEDVERFTGVSPIPVVNALTDGHHPCQSVADLLTLTEHKGPLERIKLAYLGDGNNVAVSLMQAGALAGTTVALACPSDRSLQSDLVDAARATARENGGDIITTGDPAEALRDADAVYTDVWLSMGDSEGERAARRAALAPFQVNAAAMQQAKRDAIFMHCLPAHRGEEVTGEVMDGPASVVFDQAENRLHSAQAILYALIEGKLGGNEA